MAFKKPIDNDFYSKDKKVEFDPIPHTYTYEGNHLTSVTQFIKGFTKPFNPLFASNTKSKKNIKEKKGITNPIILRKYWRIQGERASSNGTAAHAFAELYILDRTTKPQTGYEKAIVKAIKKLEENWKIVSQEEIVYNTEYMLAGSIDLILQHKVTKEYALGDWKTTQDMHKGYGKLSKPFNIKNKALNKNSIQLDIYSELYHKPIPKNNRIIIQIKSDGTFEFYTPLSIKKENKLPYTADLTKKALIEYKLQNNI